MIATHEVTVPIAAIYPLDEIKAAVAHALQGGKVLLEVGAPVAEMWRAISRRAA
jgi:hypothetical protein